MLTTHPGRPRRAASRGSGSASAGQREGQTMSYGIIVLFATATAAVTLPACRGR
jgi:hypothetical protein